MSHERDGIDRLYHSVIGAFYEVYNTLGYGLFEQLYMKALEMELQDRGHVVRREVRAPVTYKGRVLGVQRLDMLVDEALIVEGKSTEFLSRTAPRQLRSYLRGTVFRHGLLLHFGAEPRFFRLGRGA